MRRLLSIVLGAASTLATSIAAAQIPAGYPGSYADTIAAALKEGKVVIYSTTDSSAASPLIKDFGRSIPASRSSTRT
jgi:iron(III) transport system substrate-binding protein